MMGIGRIIIVLILFVLFTSQAQARFGQHDDWEGDPTRPISLNKHLYASSNPVNRVDPTGRADFTLAGVTVSINVNGVTRVSTNKAKQAQANAALKKGMCRLAEFMVNQVVEEIKNELMFGGGKTNASGNSGDALQKVEARVKKRIAGKMPKKHPLRKALLSQAKRKRLKGKGISHKC